MRTKREAVEEIRRTATTWRVAHSAETALNAGTDAALTKALVDAKTKGTTGHVIDIANEQLGYKK